MSFTPQPPTSCETCGALIHRDDRELHAGWHARQQSTEQLILSNLSIPAYLMDQARGVPPHGR